MTMTSQGNNASTSTEFRRQAARAAGRLRDTAVHVGHLVEARTSDPLLVSARAGAGRAVTVARANRTALTTVAGVLAAAVLARKARRVRRARRQR
ncbi:hypothetical protein ACFYZ4_00905 [Streptomyces sp. NPDC001513]|uniref:hypothetical protein n=1 Tax=Streptomyces sp. NPDC001513 TaxID=3364580 RepID=UPI0036743940